MNRIEKIVQIILSQILSSERIEVTEEKLTSLLLQKGFHVEEIDQALQLIFDRLNDHLEISYPALYFKRKPVRVLSFQEKSKMTNEAQNLLFYLYHRDNLTHAQMEEIISVVESYSETVDEDVMHQIIIHVLSLEFRRKKKKIAAH
ncbi:MAG: DUF494 family protein [Spirochaetes bacterium]|nr:DUF494 family protein [Spirochaetota bacterium]